MTDYSKDYTNLHGEKGKQGFTHSGFYEGTDSRSPRGKWKVLLYSKGDYWVSSVHLTKYRKKDGLPEGNFPMYQLILDSIQPIKEN